MEQETTMTREKILYDAAVQLMREADDVETYRLAEKLFRRIPQWKDALKKANACQREQHEIREELDDEWKQFKAERRRRGMVPKTIPLRGSLRLRRTESNLPQSRRHSLRARRSTCSAWRSVSRGT